MRVDEETGEIIRFERFAQTFEQYKDIVDKYRHSFNIFNTLATVFGGADSNLGGKEENMRRRQVIFIDFDKKDNPSGMKVEDFTKQIKDRLPLFLHASYDSGHGFHFYIRIDETKDIRTLVEINKHLCAVVGADTNACSVTQIARIPTSYNLKHIEEGKTLLMTEINHYANNKRTLKNFHPSDLSYIKQHLHNYNKIIALEQKNLQSWNYSDSLKQYPCLCTEKILREGAEEGQRNVWLGRIISMLHFRGYMDSKIREQCQKWNELCRPPKNPRILQNEVDVYLEKIDLYKLNGCWEKISDPRVQEFVKTQCDKAHCQQHITGEHFIIEEKCGVQMSTKLFTKSHLHNSGKLSLSGYEYLIMTVLYQYLRTMPMEYMTVRDLKKRLQYKKSGKWQLCMDEGTLKHTLQRLVDHTCIELLPGDRMPGAKRITYDDTRIVMKRGLKILDDKYIEFYYSAARAVIANQITQREFKVFLCIIHNMRVGKSCSYESMSEILGYDKANISKAIINLEKAQCINMFKRRSEESGKFYNWYRSVHTDIYDEITEIDLPIKLHDRLNRTEKNAIEDNVIEILA